MTIWQVFQQGKSQLATTVEPQACAFECYVLIETAFHIAKHQLLLNQNAPAPQKEAEHFFALVQKRCQGYPLQYLAGQWEFYGYPFFVGEGVLIPRADTEILAELCLAEAISRTAPRIADLCSGSGCLPIVFAKEAPDALVWAVELSPQALTYLNKNVAYHCCGNISVIAGDIALWQPPEPLDIISSNPPYLTAEEMSTLQKEVTFEPAMALEAPENGLYFYRLIAQRYFAFLKPGGLLAFEVGWKQAQAVEEILSLAGYASIGVKEDFSGIQRVVYGYRPQTTL